MVNLYYDIDSCRLSEGFVNFVKTNTILTKPAHTGETLSKVDLLGALGEDYTAFM